MPLTSEQQGNQTQTFPLLYKAITTLSGLNWDLGLVFSKVNGNTGISCKLLSTTVNTFVPLLLDVVLDSPSSSSGLITGGSADFCPCCVPVSIIRRAVGLDFALQVHCDSF